MWESTQQIVRACKLGLDWGANTDISGVDVWVIQS